MLRKDSVPPSHRIRNSSYLSGSPTQFHGIAAEVSLVASFSSAFCCFRKKTAWFRTNVVSLRCVLFKNLRHRSAFEVEKGNRRRKSAGWRSLSKDGRSGAGTYGAVNNEPLIQLSIMAASKLRGRVPGENRATCPTRHGLALKSPSVSLRYHLSLRLGLARGHFVEVLTRGLLASFLLLPGAVSPTNCPIRPHSLGGLCNADDLNLS